MLTVDRCMVACRCMHIFRCIDIYIDVWTCIYRGMGALCLENNTNVYFSQGIVASLLLASSTGLEGKY